MLADRPHASFSLDNDADHAGDRSMLILQYATGALAMISAILLAFVR